MKRELTYHELVGRTVIDRTGRRVGRVADLRAANVGGQLRVVGLLVGRRGLLARLGLHAGGIIGQHLLPGYFVPWLDVGQIDHVIQLRIPIETLQKLEDTGGENAR